MRVETFLFVEAPNAEVIIMVRNAGFVGFVLAVAMSVSVSSAEAGGRNWGRYRSIDQGFNGISHGRQWGDGGLYGGPPQHHTLYQAGPQGGMAVRVNCESAPSITGSTVVGSPFFTTIR